MMFKMKYEIVKQYITPKTQRRPGLSMPYVGFIVSHDTGNDGSSASANVRYYENSHNEISASAHTFIDDKQIIECIPATTAKPEKAWHVRYNVKKDNELYGGDANDIAIGVELCYSHKRGAVNNQEAYKRYVWYHAYLCHTFKLDPSKHIAGHDELDPERKVDPFKNALKLMGISKGHFIQDVQNELKSCTQMNKSDGESKGVKKLDKLAVAEAHKAIDRLAKEGILSSPDYWKARVEESLPVWAYMIMEYRKIK